MINNLIWIVVAVVLIWGVSFIIKIFVQKQR